MRRGLLITYVLLGALITGISATGLFAALSDTARTGENHIETPAQAGAADLKIATSETFDEGYVECGEFSDNLTTGLISLSATEDQQWPIRADFCLHNMGAHSLNLFAAVETLTDVDVSCTGDEALVDTSCGDSAAGELAPLIQVEFRRTMECPVGSSIYGPMADAAYLPEWETGRPIGTIGGGELLCMRVELRVEGVPTAAQSDRAAWVFRFDASSMTILVPPPGGGD